ncbi:MAG: hypothetical protein UR84_C0016G0012 [candidate division WS6 bacterium GW2011_GWD1_35_594]|uniref:Uncharacterized protein n=2 Tax=Candidatus Dojkabacteria TaxID=74243 RepID=A0A0G0AFB1_9BACT|nr:MAG: hypothetical protein UR36_C0005G0034 [candidate division WS6 bacterium GW2011_GWF1_33_233]KKP53791.1 MAG: hypothetical protein UR45_C0025G0002 [candidate division WS6 bacterium GW2011_WS6_33_547]KKP55258.1 MAG: hypothetical protein UR47_C0003G0034 [candidate division WS6 bacterium GW2011_GWB1_33_6]KKP55997.1 MAG: hypothetical protein UR49_C0022G0002 [candidate division WS6 bacterium GW2011_GWF2_33_92]KKP81779.1 MAG: hypothetical protein UR84_C0016G0012 [candidate division WS6 bacterium 
MKISSFLTFIFDSAKMNNINNLVFRNMRNIKSNSLIILLSLISPLLLTQFVNAADTQAVTATVTVSNVSLSLSDASIAYGTLSTSAVLNTTSAAQQLNDSQTITNNGNVAIDLQVQGQDSANWTLGATPGSNIYSHETCVTTCDTSPTWVPMTTSYGSSIVTNIAPLGTQDVDFQLKTPTSTTFFTQQSVNVSVRAVAT